MLVYYREITVEWGESDPFGLVYFPRMLAWFNDAEHEFFAQAGYPVKQMVEQDRTAFVMGRVNFEFVGPAAYGERIITRLELAEISNSTLTWGCRASRRCRCCTAKPRRDDCHVHQRLWHEQSGID